MQENVVTKLLFLFTSMFLIIFTIYSNTIFTIYCIYIIVIKNKRHDKYRKLMRCKIFGFKIIAYIYIFYKEINHLLINVQRDSTLLIFDTK